MSKKHKIIYVMVGLPLSGKTTWIKENKDLYTDDFKYISADKLKEEHPDYNPEEAYKLHEWSVQEAKTLLLKVHAANSESIIFDSGSINNKYTLGIFKELIELDYYIVLVHINTPYRVCLERNKKRERKVPEKDITDKALKEISQVHKLKALSNEFINVNYHTNKYIFVDMDGVIAAQSALPIINGEIDFVNGEIHKWQAPVKPVIDKLRMLEANGHILYILSATPNSFSSVEKIEWLEKYFPIEGSKIFFVNQGKHKAEMLDNLRRRLKLDKADVVLIEDTHSTIASVINKSMNSMHISEFLTHDFGNSKDLPF